MANIEIQASAFVEKNADQPVSEYGATHRIGVKAFKHIAKSGASAGDTVALVLGPTPANFVIDKVLANVEEVFNATGTLSASFGIYTGGAIATELLAIADLKTAGPVVSAAGAVPAAEASGADPVDLALVLTLADNADTITEGLLTLHLGMYTLNER